MECCTGQTECNHVVTIGYLKNFIGDNIQNTAGTVVHVTTSQPDTYCPTYSELTGGTLIPNFVDGGSNNWGSSIDGISITGSYSGNQVVNQDDLILTYVRHKSFTISAAKTTFSECGDSTNLSYVWKLTRTIKSMVNCVAVEASSDSNDTTDADNNITFTSSQSWLRINNTTDVASADKNGDWQAPARSANISAAVYYKGRTYSASNSITIRQNALGGDYTEYDRRYYTGVEITGHTSITSTTCNAVDHSISAEGYYYDRYFWVDTCNETHTDHYRDIDGSEDAGSVSGSFSKVLCPTESQTNTDTLTIEYHGHTDSLTFYQVCNQVCDCSDDAPEYGECSATANVGNCGGDVEVSCCMPTTIRHKGWVDGECVVTSTTVTCYTQTAIVTIPENTEQGGAGATCTHTGSITTEEGGKINYTITQDCSSPCGGCIESGTSVTWYDTSVNVGACETARTVSLTGVEWRYYSNCDPESGSVSTTTDITFEQNDTNQEKTFNKGYSNATIHVTQSVGLVITPSGSIPYNPTSPVTLATYNTNTSLTNLGVSSSESWASTGLTIGSGTIQANIGQNPSTTQSRQSTITVTGTTNGETCTKTFTITQSALGCSCQLLTIDKTSASWGWDGTGITSSVTASYDSCITNISINTLNNFTVTTGQGTNSIVYTIKPSAENTGQTAISETLTISYTAASQSCSSAVTLTQGGKGCSCEDLQVPVDTLTWVYNDTAAKTKTYTITSGRESCITAVTAASTASNPHFTVSVNTSTKTITVTPNSTAGQNSITETIKVGYTSGTHSCESAFTATHQGSNCNCDSVTFTPTSNTAWTYDNKDVKTGATFALGTCNTIKSATSSDNWFTVAITGTSITVTPSNFNDTNSDKTATITVVFTANGSDCPSKTFNVVQGHLSPCSILPGTIPSSISFNAS